MERTGAAQGSPGVRGPEGAASPGEVWEPGDRPVAAAPSSAPETATTSAPASEADPRACVSCGTSEDTAVCGHCGVARVAGRYGIVRVISESARGRVYEAISDTGRRVALKELSFATVPGAQELEQFETEAHVLRSISHPQIPRFVDSFRTGAGVHTRLYLAQELVRGETLAARLQTHRFDEAEVRALARQALEVLGFLHGLKPRLIHRDVKPMNLILRTDGTLALVDFGTVREVRNDRTHSASFAGSFGYAPVEQLGGTIDATSDLYALGATLVHLLSRTHPHELMDRAMELQFAERIDVSPGMRAWLARMVARHPADRFPSVAAAREALEGTALTLASMVEDPPATTEFEAELPRSFGSLDLAAYHLKLKAQAFARRARGFLIGACLALAGLGALAWAGDEPPVTSNAIVTPSPIAPPRSRDLLTNTVPVQTTRDGVRVDVRHLEWRRETNVARIQVIFRPSVSPAEMRRLVQLELEDGSLAQGGTLTRLDANEGGELVVIAFPLRPGQAPGAILIDGHARFPLLIDGPRGR
ncbi:MAG: serine/threonine protein kinase [Deltaproteobacteria bacterium]|nr:serine/threonine protein kinase [Deltaproteobacteria bacterium]